MMNTISKTKIIFIAAGTLIVGLLLGWLIFGGNNEDEQAAQLLEEVAEETTWTCSMHPQIRQPDPGDCPICGMDLIPLEDEEGEVDPMAVSMSPTAMQLANVTTDVVGKMMPVKSLRLNGKVQEDERLLFSQTSHIPGRIEQLMVNFTGDYVSKGQTIAYIYSPELVTAQEELFEAYRMRDSQPRLYQAARGKLKNWKLTDQQIDRIIESENLNENFPVLADASGYVTEKMVNVGDYVQRGAPIYKIANLSQVWVLFDVYESDMPWVNKGDNVTFTVSSLPGEEFEGTISYIDPVIDPQTRVANARVEVNNRGLLLKPEMFASGTVEAQLPGKANSLTIPKSAVMWTGERSVVYVKSVTDAGVSFVMREVKLGPSLGDAFVVQEGLMEGEEIAVHGTFSIDAAAQLAGKPSMMNTEGGAMPTGHNHGEMDMHDESEHKIMGEQMQLSPEIEQAQFHVAGNCGMCQATIEEAAKSVSGVKTANWNMETKQVQVTYNHENTSLGKIHKAIAGAGYDTEKEKAPQEVYENLPQCCKYTRESDETEEKELTSARFEVLGNCGMCKTRIEEAAKGVEGVQFADWNQETKMIQLEYDSDKVKESAVHKAIARAGHDTEKEKAPDEVYNDLPGCCLYTRE